jgi:SAM-dependent methyltransferase
MNTSRDSGIVREYDLELFEQLNDEFREKPVSAPLPPDKAALPPSEIVRFSVEKNLKPIMKELDLAGKTVLELGCGHGWLTASLPTNTGVARAIGVDIRRFSTWDEQNDPRVTMIVADLADQEVLARESVDVVISRVTFEHVTRPLQMIGALYNILKFGGKMWVHMNLHRARNASHCYREVFFPWPHLLFEDDVCEAFYQKHHPDKVRRFIWVNRMTVAHYLLAFCEAGFDMSSLSRRTTPIDIDFYLRFIDKLGRYPALDLETNFLTLVVDKNEVPTGAVPSVGYLERQRELDRAVAEWQELEIGSS